MATQPKTNQSHRKADQYDDGSYNYLQYWHGRDYEHRAEVMAIRRLLKGKHFKNAIDVGGGYGRLTILLTSFADEVTLMEPSHQQLTIAKTFLKQSPGIKRVLAQADDLKLEDGSVDLVTMIRVMHHLPDPMPELTEIARVLSEDGYAIIEVANYMHAQNRIRHLVHRKKFSKKPIDIRSAEHQTEEEIPFVNHNPYTVIKQLKKVGLTPVRILSVSNLRSPGLKKIIPHSLMLIVEGVLQPVLAKSYFGPSVFFLVKKTK